MKKEKWVDKNKSLPERGKVFEAKDKDGDIIIGLGMNGKLKISDLKKDEYLTHWRYAKKLKP